MRDYLLGGQTGSLPDHSAVDMDKRTVLSIPENTYLYAKIIHNGKERIHAGQQGLAVRKGKGRGSDAAPEGYLLQGAGIGPDRTASIPHRGVSSPRTTGWTINGKKFQQQPQRCARSLPPGAT